MSRQELFNYKLLVGPVVGMSCILLLFGTIYSIEESETIQEKIDTHSLGVLAQTSEVEKDLVAVETGKRSYFLTGETIYLAPIELVKQSVPVHLQELRRLFAGQPEQLKRLVQLEDILTAMLVEPVSPPSTGAGRIGWFDAKVFQQHEVAVNRVQALVHQMQADEQAVLNHRTEKSRFASRFTRVLAEIPALEKAILEQEGAQRAYLLTGNANYLRIYEEKAVERDFALGFLSRLLTGDSTQFDRLAEIKQMITRWETEVAQVEIQAKRDKRDVRHFGTWSEGRRLMHEIRGLLAGFQLQVMDRFDQVNREAKQERKFRLAMMGWATGGALILLTMATWYSLRSYRRQLQLIVTAENQARSSEARFQNFMNHSPSVSFIKDSHFRFVYVNQTFEELFHKTLEEVRGKTDFDLWPEEVARVLRQHDEEILQTRQPSRVLEQMPTPDQERDWLAVKFPFTDDQGHILVGGVAVEVTKERKALEALAMERERLAVTLRSIGDGVITTDVQGHVILLNKVAEQLTGWRQDDAAGRPLTEVFHILHEKTREHSPSPLDRVLAGRQILERSHHTILVARDGTEHAIAESAAPIFDQDSKIIGVVLVFRDETEKQYREEERRKADRLESIGLLAGGIAHDFNNILTAIVGNIALARLSLIEGDPAWERLQNAEKASYRARDLAQQLLTFSKGGTPVKKTESVAVLVRETTEFFLRGSNAKAEIVIPEDLWPVNIDTVQIGQVIENIVVNADQAMPSGGLLRVSCENVVLPVSSETAQAAGSPRFVKIVIRDQGIGIPKEYLRKVFDPYFTTKSKGSGLGLATAYSIVKKHGGLIKVNSELGEGTTFSIFLPASESGQVVVAKPLSEQLNLGGGRILFMDDEPMIRELMPQMLAPFGYIVTSVADGQEALEAYRRSLMNQEPFVAIILDLTIPGGMGGKELMVQLRDLDPTVKGIVSSGYANDPVMAHYLEYGFKGVVHKPYEISELQRVVYHVVFETDPR